MPDPHASFTVGDTAPALTGSVNTDVTGATVELHIKKPGGEVLTKPAAIVTAATGAWSYEWAADDIDEAGPWEVEAQVTFIGPKVQTFGPSSFYVRRQIA
jgi:hypothetical protein